MLLLIAVEEENQRGIALPAHLSLVPMLLVCGLVALVIAALENISDYCEEELRAVGSSKTMWIILVFMLRWISSIFYFATRPPTAAAAPAAARVAGLRRTS